MTSLGGEGGMVALRCASIQCHRQKAARCAAPVSDARRDREIVQLDLAHATRLLAALALRNCGAARRRSLRYIMRPHTTSEAGDGSRLLQIQASANCPLADTFREETAMNLSARNQIMGVVKSVKLGGVMAEVVVDIGGNEVVAAITRTSAQSLNLQERKPVTVIIKSTEVMLATD